MLWRSSFLPLRTRALPLYSAQIISEPYLYRRCTNSARNEYEWKKQREAANPNREWPNAKHARLLGDGNPYRPEQLEDTLKVTGLVRSVRKQKHQAFAHISDGTTYEPVQAVLSPGLSKDLTNGAYVELLGKWQPSPAKGQSHELSVSDVISVGVSNPEEHPIQKQSMSTDYLRSIPHMRIRTALHSLLARTRSQVIRTIGNHFESGRRQPVVQVHPPLITSSDCEGAGEVFTISPRNHTPLPRARMEEKKVEAPLYFRNPKYLTVSSQLHLEAWAAELGEVWTLSPTFRAEESDTPRHLSEFYMLEAEYRGLTRVEAVAARVQLLIKNIVQELRQHRTGKELLEFAIDHKHRPSDKDRVDLGERWSKLEEPYQFISYTDAMEELYKAHAAENGHLFKSPPKWQNGLQLEHERWIVQNIGKDVPTFVTHYPQTIKPFYMLPSTASDLARGKPQLASVTPGPTVACFDLLLPYGYCEVVGGSLREHRLEHLISSMREKGLLKPTTNVTDVEYPYLQPGESLGSLQWYADLRRHGSSPHGGFGLGFDRLLAYLTGISNVRDVVGFPRSWGRADC